MCRTYKIIVSITVFIIVIIAVLKIKANYYNEDDLYDNLLLSDCKYDSYVYDEYDDHTIITSYNGDDKNIVIPTKINGKTVECIADSAFYGDVTLEKVTFNEGLLKIGHQAFIGCENLREIHISSTVCDIGEASFWGCNKLKNVDTQNNSCAQKLLKEFGVIK